MIALEELKARSGLPGPRGNLELLHQYLAVCTLDSVRLCLAELRPDTANSPEEFVGMCGVAGFAVLNSDNLKQLAEHLRTYSRHSSWRIRESVAIALQEIRVASLEDRLKITQALEDEDPLVCRAIVAGLCEPRNLRQQRGIHDVYRHLWHATGLVDVGRRLSEGEESLKKALGYCWSVALSEFFDEGRVLFENLVEMQNKPIRWIVAENLKKRRLNTRHPAWVAQQVSRLRAP